MVVPVSWPRYMPQSVRAPMSGGPVDGLYSFQPDAGPSIDRPRFTGSMRQYRFEFPAVSVANADRFLTWVDSDLKHRSQPFLFRDDSALRALWSWRMVTPPKTAYVAETQIGAAFDALRLPAQPWFADYVPTHLAEVPVVVADWVNGVFALNGVRVTASDLAFVSGYFDGYAQNGATTSADPGYYVASGSLGPVPPTGVTQLVLFTGHIVTSGGVPVTVGGEQVVAY